MPDQSFKLTRDLTAALEEVTGAEATSFEPVVALAAYIDELAKEYGLSESLHLDVDPLERTQQVPPVMAIVNHHFAADGPDLDADAVRARLYDVFTKLADDTKSRMILKRDRPLSENRTLHLAQIYWNLEAAKSRPKLPLRPGDGRDIPVPGTTRDFATMTWTARVNEKCACKSSGQSFRTQGARLAVLAAQHLIDHSPPMPGSPMGELEVHRTPDPEEPVEITLKGLALRAWHKGEYDDAVDLSTSYLRIIERRAGANPFELESELAGAHLLKGMASLRRAAGGKQEFLYSGEASRDDIEKAVRGFTTLTELDPQNEQHKEDLCEAFIFLSMANEASGRVDDAVLASQRAVSIADEMSGRQPENIERLGTLRFALTFLFHRLRRSGRLQESVAAISRAITVAEELVETQPSEAANKEALVQLLWGLTQGLEGSGRLDEAVEAASRAVSISETLNQELLASSLMGLDHVLCAAGRVDDAIAAATRAVAIRDSLTSAPGANEAAQFSLAASLVGLTLVLQGAERLDEAAEATSRSITILESLVAADDTNTRFLEILQASYTTMCRFHRQAGQFDGAARAARRAAEICKHLAAAEPDNPDYLTLHLGSLIQLKEALRALGRFDDAEAVNREFEDALRAIAGE